MPQKSQTLKSLPRRYLAAVMGFYQKSPKPYADAEASAEDPRNRTEIREFVVLYVSCAQVFEKLHSLVVLTVKLVESSRQEARAKEILKADGLKFRVGMTACFKVQGIRA